MSSSNVRASTLSPCNHVDTRTVVGRAVDTNLGKREEPRTFVTGIELLDGINGDVLASGDCFASISRLNSSRPGASFLEKSQLVTEEIGRK